jgi:hypothetical protein
MFRFLRSRLSAALVAFFALAPVGAFAASVPTGNIIVYGATGFNATNATAGSVSTTSTTLTGYAIGTSCPGPIIIYFYGTTAPTVGTTQPIWSVVLQPQPANGMQTGTNMGGTDALTFVTAITVTNLTYAAVTQGGACPAGSFIDVSTY